MFYSVAVDGTDGAPYSLVPGALPLGDSTLRQTRAVAERVGSSPGQQAVSRIFLRLVRWTGLVKTTIVSGKVTT